MHPKNIYKNPPNFKDLAIQYPKFRKYVIQELSGKVTIDYQDPNAVKELTETLLKKDFGLNVEINETRLIPRLPLCLNYILWIDDLLGSLNEEKILGIDIGTGCVCIYSLLGAKRGWEMLATEIDPDNFKSATNNVINNDLEGKISVKFVSDTNHLLAGILDEGAHYSFCMCNPPFFNYKEKPQNRSSRRPKVNTVASEVSTEIYTNGGELFFIRKLISESKTLQHQVKIYTTLVGKKSDFLLLKKEIQEIFPKSIAHTEFRQGRTLRWGLAWTFLDINLNLKKKLECEKKKKEKTKTLHITLPDKTESDLDVVLEEVKKVMGDLKISFSENTTHSDFTLVFKAYDNTWSHQRRKKRLKERSDHTEARNTVMNNEDINGCCSKKPKLDETLENCGVKVKPVIVEGLIHLLYINSAVNFEMSWLSGDKESLHQVFQYFKNYWSKDKSIIKE